MDRNSFTPPTIVLVTGLARKLDSQAYDIGQGAQAGGAKSRLVLHISQVQTTAT